MRPTSCLALFAVILASAGCGSSNAAPAPESSSSFVLGQVATDPKGWMEYIPGDAPLVIIAPHGGLQTPTELPDRNCSGCETVNDANTQDLARRIVDAFYTRTGARPHLVLNRLSRRKFDANRDLPEASGGTAALSAPWAWFHAAIDSAEARIIKKTGRGLVIDLHGHAHDIARLEIGYLLNDPDLRLADAALTANGAMTRTSVARLATDSRSAADRGVALLRGPNSLGALAVAAGYPAVPSPADQSPLVGQSYFEGGYNTARHGSRDGGAIDAIQIECHYDNVRDTQTARTNFAWALSGALATYLEKHYGWKGPAS